MRQAIFLLIMTFLFASGCGPADPPSSQNKPIKENLPVEDPPKKPLRIVFYDFDQTIPVIHIFKETNGAGDVSEKSDQFFVDAFGGEERIARLKKHFERLAQAEVKCSIVSYGHTAVIRESLTRVGLIDFINEGAIIGRDSEALKRFRGAKHKVISEEMVSGNIGHEEAIFVDDSKDNIEKCVKAGICQTLHVHERRGLTEKNLVFLENELIMQSNESHQTN